MRKASDFTVYERGGIWYVQWLSRKGKRYWKSTGERVQPKLKDRGQKAALCAAATIIGSGRRSEPPVLAEYAKDFYHWDASSFIKRQHAKGRGFNRAWANALQSMMEHHVFPAFGSMRMEDLNRPMVEEWLVKLPLSNQTRNQILYALRRILVEAESEGLILRNPLNHVEPMGKGGRVRDVFALEELRQMFPPSQEELIAVWKTLKYAALFITMATTGIREGEARVVIAKQSLFSTAGWKKVTHALPEELSFQVRLLFHQLQEAKRTSLRIVVGVSRFPNLLILPFFESTQNQSPFPPPTFAGFIGTMGSSDSRRGPDLCVRWRSTSSTPTGLSCSLRFLPCVLSQIPR